MVEKVRAEGKEEDQEDGPRNVQNSLNRFEKRCARINDDWHKRSRDEERRLQPGTGPLSFAHRQLGVPPPIVDRHRAQLGAEARRRVARPRAVLHDVHLVVTPADAAGVRVQDLVGEDEREQLGGDGSAKAVGACLVKGLRASMHGELKILIDRFVQPLTQIC